MSSRDHEHQLLMRCAQAARGNTRAQKSDEANLFRLASQLVKSSYPAEATRLARASDEFFKAHGDTGRMRFPDMVQSGVVRDLPRFRNMLVHYLKDERVW